MYKELSKISTKKTSQFLKCSNDLNRDFTKDYLSIS